MKTSEALFRHNALAETIGGLYETEPIHPRMPWITEGAVALVTLNGVSWFNMGPLEVCPTSEGQLISGPVHRTWGRVAFS